MKTPVLLLFLSVLVASAREMRDLKNTDGKTIRAEILELTPSGVVKVSVNLKPFDIPLVQLSEEDQVWLRNWDSEQKLGKEAGHYSREIFSDDFSSNEFGPKWGHYKSGSVVRDGVLQGITPDGSDHAAVDNVIIDPERDLEVSVKFRFISDKAKRLDVWLDDRNHKGSHAGHICLITISPTEIGVMDAKEGLFRKDIWEQRKLPDGLSKETNAYLKDKSTRFEVKAKIEEWHTLLVRTKEDEVTVLLDGKKAGAFKSQGIGHETKSVVSLTTNLTDIHCDDFTIRAAGRKAKSP